VDMVLTDELDTDILAPDFKRFVARHSKDKRHAKAGGGGGGGGGGGKPDKKKDVGDVKKCMSWMVSSNCTDPVLQAKWSKFLIDQGLLKKVIFKSKELDAMYNGGTIDAEIKDLLDATPDEYRPSKQLDDDAEEEDYHHSESDESEGSKKNRSFELESDDEKKMSPTAKSSAAKSKMSSAMNEQDPAGVKRNLNLETATGAAKKPRVDDSTSAEGEASSTNED
jgi:hypothetical protein